MANKVEILSNGNVHTSMKRKSLDKYRISESSPLTRIDDGMRFILPSNHCVCTEIEIIFSIMKFSIKFPYFFR